MKARIVFVACLLVAAASLAPRAQGISTLSVPGRANAHVSIASAGPFVAAVWSASAPDGTTDIYAATSSNAGEGFSAPVRVNASAGEARVNGEQPPRLALSSRLSGPPEVIVLWTAKGPAGTRLLTARSIDGGRTFARTSLVPGTDAAGNRGWESLAAGRGTQLFAAWLDHRRLAAQETTMEAGHHHGGAHAAPSSAKADGVAMAQLSDLYIGNLADGSTPKAIASGVCYCCKTAVVSGPSGDVFVAWRHVYTGNLRDIAFAASRDGGRTFSAPVRVSEDRWEIAGCPDDGPTMAVERTGRVHVAWPTVISENGEMVKALFHAVSEDGRVFSPRQRIPTKGQANHPQMILERDGAVVVAWDESGDGARRIASARGTRNSGSAVSFDRLPSSGKPAGTYPALALTPDAVLMAWTTGDPASSVVRIEKVR